MHSWGLVDPPMLASAELIVRWLVQTEIAVERNSRHPVVLRALWIPADGIHGVSDLVYSGRNRFNRPPTSGVQYLSVGMYRSRHPRRSRTLARSP